MKEVSLVSVAVLAMSLLAACDTHSRTSASRESALPQLTAASLGQQAILEISDYLALEPYRSADRENGARQALVCKACHSVNEGGPNMIGPALYGIFERRAAKLAGFEYSPAMQAVDFAWTPRALDAWLAQPGRFLPGNRMTFSGVHQQQDRNDLIVYLLATTAGNDAL